MYQQINFVVIIHAQHTLNILVLINPTPKFNYFENYLKQVWSQ